MGMFRHEHPLVKSIQERTEVLFLIEVTLMFSSLFLLQGALWIAIVFHAVGIAWVIFVLWFASRVAKVIPPSIPFQRPMGVILYVVAHSLQYFWPGQLPIWLAGTCLITAPLAMVFLFEP